MNKPNFKIIWHCWRTQAVSVSDELVVKNIKSKILRFSSNINLLTTHKFLQGSVFWIAKHSKLFWICLNDFLNSGYASIFISKIILGAKLRASKFDYQNLNTEKILDFKFLNHKLVGKQSSYQLVIKNLKSKLFCAFKIC